MVKELRLTDILVLDFHIDNDGFSVVSFTEAVVSNMNERDTIATLEISEINENSSPISLEMDLDMVRKIRDWCAEVVQLKERLEKENPA
jgi:hypothetical protein